MNFPLDSGVRVILFYRGALAKTPIPIAVSGDIGIAKSTARKILQQAEKQAAKEKTLTAIGRARSLKRDLKLIMELA